MAKTLKTEKIKELYKSIILFPNDVNTLKLREKHQVLKYAQKVNNMALSFCANLMDTNPGYDYPPKYLPDRIIDYWKERNNHYCESSSVLQVLRETQLNNGNSKAPGNLKPKKEKMSYVLARAYIIRKLMVDEKIPKNLYTKKNNDNQWSKKLIIKLLKDYFPGETEGHYIHIYGALGTGVESLAKRVKSSTFEKKFPKETEFANKYIESLKTDSQPFIKSPQ